MTHLAKLAVALTLVGTTACVDPPGPDDMGGDDPGGTGEGSGDGSGSGSGSGEIPEPDPEPGYVNVVVTSSHTGALVENHRVIFSRTDGTVVADTVTNAQGVATAQMDDGYVTIVRNGSTGPSTKVVHTVLDVRAGDTVRFGPDPSFGTGDVYANVTHQAIPADHQITVHTPCETATAFDPGTTTVTGLEVRPVAACSTNIPMISAAGTYDSSTFSRIPQLFSVASGQTLSATGVAMPAWTPALTTSHTITGVPQGIRIPYGLTASMLVGSTNLFAQYKSSPYADANGTIASSFKRPQAFGDRFLFEGTWEVRDEPYIGEQKFAVEGALADAVATPYASTRARWLLTPSVSLANGAKLMWTAQGPSADDADVAWVGVRYHNGAGYGVVWTVLGPAQPGLSGAIALPRLPDDLHMDVTSYVSDKRFAVVAADGASYADLRERIAHYMSNAIELDWLDFVGHGEVVRELAQLPNVTGARMSMSPRP